MWSSSFIAWWNAWNALSAFESSLGFWIGHYKPDFNRLKTRCDKQFDTGPLLISAICKEARLNGNTSAKRVSMVEAMAVHT